MEDEKYLLLEKLKKEHKELDEKINLLQNKKYLTEDEKIEIARLKKLKLKKKDEIYSLMNSS